MPIRISGLASGLDTESIVDALVSAYSYKKEKYVKAQTKLSWKQDAWKSLNSKVYSLYTSVGNLRYSSNYALKKTSVSDSTKASVTAGASAINGTQTLEITNLAKTGFLTSGQLGSSVTEDTTLADLGYEFEENKDTGTINATIGGTTTSISVDSTTTVGQFVSQLNKAGITASFDSSNKRIFVSAKESGVDNDFSLLGTNVAGLKALSVLGLVTEDDISRMETDKSYATYTDDEFDGDATKSSLQSKIFSIHNAYVTLQDSNATDEEKETAQSLIDSNEDFISYVNSVMGSTFDWIQTDATEAVAAVYTRVEAAATTGSADLSSDPRGTKINGEDSVIKLNGIEYSSSSSAITVNGLTIECLAKTDTDSPITLNTSTDVTGLYDKVKEFLSSYNSVINEMMKLYNAESASDYEPLTDDEKAEMSETEIEKWEQKIKDSLLRRDSSLSSLISTMTTSMMRTYDYNGSTYSWSIFGIHTLGTLNAADNENYAYHIDGDSEDSNTSGNTDKLLKALTEDPDAVIDFMKNVTSGLYAALDTKMKSSAVKSVYTVYNDKEMASEYSSYTDLIKTWTTRVEDMEEAYYKKFSAMESALATLQSNSSSLSSLLG